MKEEPRAVGGSLPGEEMVPGSRSHMPGRHAASGDAAAAAQTLSSS